MNTEVAGQRTIHHLVRLNASAFTTILNEVDSNVWFHKWQQPLFFSLALSFSASWHPSSDDSCSSFLFTVGRDVWWMSHDIKTLCKQCKSTWMIFTNGIPSWIQIKTVYNQTISQLLFYVTFFFLFGNRFSEPVSIVGKNSSLSCISLPSCIIISFYLILVRFSYILLPHMCTHQLISSWHFVYGYLY